MIADSSPSTGAAFCCFWGVRTDNFAVGYFRKQGFTQKISMPKEKWFGFIKDYEGGTLMECHISSKVDYLRLYEVLSEQQKAVQRAIMKLRPPRVFPGLTCWQVSLIISSS